MTVCIIYFSHAYVYRCYYYITVIPVLKERKCFDISLHALSDGYTWEVGECHSTHKYSGAYTYTEKCCLPNDDNLLSCKSTQYHGWIDSNVKIGDHSFCDDMLGYNKFIRINLAGKYRYTHTP